ncbi:efflux transporter outer membrane subunit [Acidocella sp.]|uniref:efflux transporter outer membrane subunit n=1 Tax=Acidocella sp. TaxID=50710 RepID=UPI002634C380|nr:efflux transporter outer membrane subunit [Acidocella sp.]
MNASFLRAALCLGLSGCMLGPDFTPPAPPAAANFQHAGAFTTEQTNPDPNWWNGFDDPVLTQIMQTAIAGNISLQQAVLRVEQAHENVVQTRAEGLPSINAGASFMREQEGIKGIAESSGAYDQLDQVAAQANAALPGSGPAVTNAVNSALDKLGQPVNFWQYQLSSSWELDLFGRVRRSVEAARANENASLEAARDSLVMLESQVAQAYFQLRAAQAALARQQQSVASAQDELDLTINRADHGLVPQSDVDQARTVFLSAQGQLPGYEKQVQQYLTQIDTLAGRPPGALDAMLTTPAALPVPPAMIATGVPSTLVRRRPDIREAEDQLHQATAQIGVAIASFFPDISLTGSVGFHALDASYLTNWASLFYSFGPSISLPIFQGGRLVSNLRLARLSQQNAALQYRATVLNALAEVENALVACHADQQAYADALATAQTAEDTLVLAQSRYAQGLTSFLPVLDAERTAFSAQQQQIQAQSQLDIDTAALYTALGGGWQETQQPVGPAAAAPPAPAPSTG